MRSATRSAAGERTSVWGEPGEFVGIEKSKSCMTRIRYGRPSGWVYLVEESRADLRHSVLAFPKKRCRQRLSLNVSRVGK